MTNRPSQRVSRLSFLAVALVGVGLSVAAVGADVRSAEGPDAVAQSTTEAQAGDGSAATPPPGGGSGRDGSATSGSDVGDATDSTTRGPRAATSPAARYGGYIRAMDWSLDFRPGPLRLFTTSQGKAYWYFTYRVINRTGKERMWAPRFELFTDKGAIKTSGRSVPTDVTRSILALLNDPLMQDQNQIIGEIRIGDENAKDGLVVWPADDLAVTEFTVFVTGASGKVRKVPDPRTNAPRVERWTIRFNYLVPGDPVSRGSTPVEPASTEEDVADGADRRGGDAGVWLWR